MLRKRNFPRARQGRLAFIAWLAAALLIASHLYLGAATVAGDITAATPLPNPEQLRQRALENFQKTQEQRERYLCDQTLETQQLDSKGGVKKTETQKREIFFVNGYEIFTVVSHNGKRLS